MIRAVRMWNKAPVKFERVNPNEKATFQVTYRRRSPDNNPLTLAKSFFPKSRRGVLYVYSSALYDMNSPYLDKILAHELGHILGLRHEHAESRGESTSILLGKSSPCSIMLYYNTPAAWSTVQKQDKDELAALYSLPELVVMKVKPTPEDSDEVYCIVTELRKGVKGRRKGELEERLRQLTAPSPGQSCMSIRTITPSYFLF
ncbi:hypothetical protein M426DRAFT_15022 [Hypoxylon sp. CI-4A]|nr:hypothetical protein M426DRAFT_15022 [Hypoxylon sp. CI-4A]